MSHALILSVFSLQETTFHSKVVIIDDYNQAGKVEASTFEA